MNLIDNFLGDESGGDQKLYELCQRYFEYKSAYTSRSLIPPPKEMALKLLLTIEEYSELSQWIENGGYEDLIQSRIANDFNKGAQFLSDKLQP